MKKNKPTRKIYRVEIKKKGRTVPGERVGSIPYNLIMEAGAEITEDFTGLSPDSKRYVTVVTSGKSDIYIALEDSVVSIEV